MRKNLHRRPAAPALGALGRAAILSTTLLLGACAQSVGDLGLGAAEAPAEAVVQGAPAASDLEKATEFWSKEHAKSPRDSKAALNYARNLKALGRKQEALGVLQSTYMFASDNRDFLSEYGRLALDMGQVSVAAKLLERADDPAKPDWRIISARGTVLAKQNDFKGAITYFERARVMAPNQASLLNNLAMAYTMDGQAERAEQLLRQAAATGSEDPRVRQNLALVLGLQGKHQEAKALRSDTGDGVPQPATAPAIASAGPAVPVTPVSAMPVVQPQPAPIVSAPKPQPAAETKPAEADDVIRAAIEADIARNKKPATPIATGSAPKKKPVVATGAAQAPTIINATGLRASAD